jgi:transposase
VIGGRGARRFGGSAGPRRVRRYVRVVADPRYRCSTCGNLTRFDVTTTRRVRAFHHYTVGGELTVEEPEVLEERVEAVVCRWCGPSGTVVEEAVVPPA